MAQPSRGKGDLTQEGLATAMKVKVGTVARWEGDTRKPGLEDLKLLAEVLGVTVGWLVNAEGGDPDFVRAANPFLPPPRPAPLNRKRTPVPRGEKPSQRKRGS